jgi:sulfur-carrier protein
MAIEVRIPTILRNYTAGAKSVEGSGDTLAGLIADLDERFKSGWLTIPGCAAS